eukprot:TRINITY_DN22735_c0_g1_i1.p1 TRINITY_DN22735_c0_g1~~TRINITY_DN22735_c0_g1_i1.p1  ORF type:complete len:633 (-),score=81.75 TRINITY_DN22735_c0_g1_i1:56-1954(-)
MGNSSGRNVVEELAAAIRRGDVSEVTSFLEGFVIAKTGGSSAPPSSSDRGGACTSRYSSDEAIAALKAVDLNAPSADGMPPLHLAARYGNVEILRLLLAVPPLNGASSSGGSVSELDTVSAVDVNGQCSLNPNWTPLHFACRFRSPPRCTDCVVELLRGRADPCIETSDATTPVELARRVGCSSCVRAVQESTKIWEGWADYFERTLFVIPSWTPKWFVISQGRRPNTGPSIHRRGGGIVTAALQGIGSAVHAAFSSQNAADPASLCPQCGVSLSVPDWEATFRCRQCRVEIVVPASLELAFYDCSGAEVASGTPNIVRPETAIVQSLSQDAWKVTLKPLEDASWQGVGSAVNRGSLKRALQNAVSSERRCGLSLKVSNYGAKTDMEHSFRLADEDERRSVMQIIKHPVFSSRRLIRATDHMAVLQSFFSGDSCGSLSSASASGAAWSCSSCTYRNQGCDSGLTFCRMCNTPRDGCTGESAPPLLPSAPGFDTLDNDTKASCQTSCHGSTTSSAEQHAQALRTVGPPAQPLQALRPHSAAEEGAAVEVAPAAPSSAELSEQPVSGSLPAGGTKEEDDGVCTVCLEKPADAAVVPCGHMCGCHDCLQMLQASRSPLCPMCRGPLTSVIRIFKS